MARHEILVKSPLTIMRSETSNQDHQETEPLCVSVNSVKNGFFFCTLQVPERTTSKFYCRELVMGHKRAASRYTAHHNYTGYTGSNSVVTLVALQTVLESFSSFFLVSQPITLLFFTHTAYTQLHITYTVNTHHFSTYLLLPLLF